MNLEEAKSFIANKFFQIEENYYHFEKGGSLLITNKSESIQGNYSIIEKQGSCYLVTNPEIIPNKKELLISIILGDCNTGISLH